MTEVLQPVLECSVLVPGVLLACFPVRTSLGSVPGKRTGILLLLSMVLSLAGGTFCYFLRIPTIWVFLLIMLVAVGAYTGSLRITLWKSGSIVLAVCAVFVCFNSLSRAVNAILRGNDIWFCLEACIFYNLLCWMFVALAYYPAAHAARFLLEDENFAGTWYVFWIFPMVFIGLNWFMVPRYQSTLYTGRVMQGYIVILLVLLALLVLFYGMFLIMAENLNRNVRLQQENHFLSMQQERYENLCSAMEEARHARHDMRHHFHQLSAMAERGELEEIKEYLDQAVQRIPMLERYFCENRAVDSVLGYYCAMAGQENIPFQVKIDLPAELPVDEMDMCLVLSNLLENALEACKRCAEGKRQMHVEVYVHSDRLLLIQVENSYEGEIRKKNGIFQSSKRRGNGVGIQSVRRICEKNGGAEAFTCENGIFTAKIMMH